MTTTRGAGTVAKGLSWGLRSVGGSVDHPSLRFHSFPVDIDIPQAVLATRTFYATLLGPFSLRRDGQIVQVGPQRACAELCRYLVAHAGRPTPGSELIELLWPEVDPARAHHRLHNAVSAARRILDQPGKSRSCIQLADDCYVIAAEVVLTDSDLFGSQYRSARKYLTGGDRRAAGEAFRCALTIYVGDYLADLPYASWAQQQRVHLSEQRLNALTFLCEQAAEDRDPAAVIEYAELILTVDEFRERAHRQLMRAHYALGQRGCALRQYRRCEDLLHRELAAAPSRATRELLEAIRDDKPLPVEVPVRF